MDFLNSGLSQFIIQTVLHSVIIVIVVEAMISLWRVQKPAWQIKFRFLALLLPAIYLPFYFLFYSSRAGVHFHEQVAVIDSNAWMRLRLGGEITLGHLFIVLLSLTTVFFLLREAVPSIKYFLTRNPPLPVVAPGQFPRLDRVLAMLAEKHYFRVPEVLLSTEPVPVVHNLRHRALVLSEDAINTLDDEELEAVIAHELAHLTGQSYRIMQISFILRFLMFYSPVALFIFRRIVSDNEKDCDDISVQVTGKRLALASGLLRIFRHTAASKLARRSLRTLAPRISALEYRFHTELIEERVERLAHPEKTGDLPYASLRVLLIAVPLMALLFFVV